MTILKTDNEVVDSPTTLRGFIGQMFRDNKLIHHHLSDIEGKQDFVYSYPRIQYKILDGAAVILGIGEASELIKVISGIEHLNLKGKKYTVIDKKLIEQTVGFGVANEMISYKFLTPWLALNEENYSRYKKRNSIEKRKQLESIIVGNILSISKGLEYVVTDELKANIIDIKEVRAKLKGTPMLGFLGSFAVNFEIPDYWGIGKSVSRGFGTVYPVKDARVR